MRFTEQFICLPCKVYNKSELRGGSFGDGEVNWKEGNVYIPFSEIKGWQENDIENLSHEESVNKRWDGTYVFTHSMGSYECLLPIKELNQLFDERFSIFQAAFPSFSVERGKPMFGALIENL